MGIRDGCVSDVDAAAVMIELRRKKRERNLSSLLCYFYAKDFLDLSGFRSCGLPKNGPCIGPDMMGDLEIHGSFAK